MVFKGLQIGLHVELQPYNTFYSGASYSAAYSYYNFVDRRKLFAVLNSPVNCLLGSWYCDPRCAFKLYQIKKIKEITYFNRV